MKWPQAVYVLTYHFDISGTAGCDKDNYPRSMFGWMQYEIRELLPTAYEMNLMIDIWMAEYHRIYPIYNRLRKESKKYNTYDLYNATWAALGYTENQSPKALQLLAIVNQLRPRS